MNRRGFLGVLAAAVAGAALDPELALWRPGTRLISIPKPRVPELHHYGVDFAVDDPLPGWELWDEFEDRYVAPAIEAIAAMIDRDCERQMYRPRFLTLPCPIGVEYASAGRFGRIPRARMVVAYDGFREPTPGYVGRVDTLISDGGGV